MAVQGINTVDDCTFAIEHILKLQGYIVIGYVVLILAHYAMIFALTFRLSYSTIRNIEQSRHLACSSTQRKLIVTKTFKVFGMLSVLMMLVYMMGASDNVKVNMILFVIPEAILLILADFVVYLRIKIKNKKSIDSDLYMCASTSAMILALILMVWSSVSIGMLAILIGIVAYNRSISKLGNGKDE